MDVSIYMTTYNHERYVGRAIESVLMQKTRYTYELLIGDDVSPDHTREVIERYRQQRPDVIRVIDRDHNMSHETPTNGGDLRSRCTGKYVVALEGDDFWTDEHKLEKQITFLEEHPEYIAVAHRCQVVGEDSRPIDEAYPQCDDENYTLSHLVSEIMPGQLATVMYRNVFKDDPLLTQALSPWDRMLYFALAAHGRVYCIQEVMSAYRHVVRGGSSFSATNRYNFAAIERWQRTMLEYAYNLSNDAAVKCAEVLYMTRLVHGVSSRNCKPADALGLLRKNVLHPARTLGLYGLYKLRKNLLKQNIYLRLE